MAGDWSCRALHLHCTQSATHCTHCHLVHIYWHCAGGGGARALLESVLASPSLLSVGFGTCPAHTQQAQRTGVALVGVYGLLVAARGAKWKWMDGLSAALRTGALGRAVLCRAGMWRASQPERREGLGVRAAWWVVIPAPSRERPESPFSFPRSWDPPRALLEALTPLALCVC
jgi:hypothetical protein